MAFKIRFFGNDSVAYNIGELKCLLAIQYAGKSVSIQTTTEDGMDRVAFVNIGEKGHVYSSFDDGELFDFDCLIQPAG